LTLVNGTVATNPATSGGLTTAPVPLPPVIETFAGNFASLEDGVAGAKVADTIPTPSAIIVAQNTKETSPVPKAADLVASAGDSASASSVLVGTSGGGGLIHGQNVNPGSAGNLSTIASTIANPAPNSIFLVPDQLSSKPETNSFDPLPGTRELPGSSGTDAVGVPAPAEATGKAGGEVDSDFDVAVFPIDQAVSAPSTDPTVVSVSAATGSDVDLAEIRLVTTCGFASPMDLAHGGSAKCSMGELVIMTSMLATYSANLAFGGAILNYGTMSWAARRWPATRFRLMSSDKQRQSRARNGPTGDLIAASPARGGPTSVVAVPRR